MINTRAPCRAAPTAQSAITSGSDTHRTGLTVTCLLRVWSSSIAKITGFCPFGTIVNKGYGTLLASLNDIVAFFT
jgi:hypothetical protein